MTIVKEANNEKYEEIIDNERTEIGCSADAASCCGGSEN